MANTSTWSNVAARQLMCVCRACYLLFTDGGAEPALRVPDRFLSLPRFGLGREWEALQIPVGVAFFFRNLHWSAPQVLPAWLAPPNWN